MATFVSRITKLEVRYDESGTPTDAFVTAITSDGTTTQEHVYHYGPASVVAFLADLIPSLVTASDATVYEHA